MAHCISPRQSVHDSAIAIRTRKTVADIGIFAGIGVSFCVALLIY